VPDQLPPFLEDDAQRLRVTWRKSVNFFNTFATQWLELKQRFDTGEFDHRRQELRFSKCSLPMFDIWAQEFGFDSSFIASILKAHELALADDQRRIVRAKLDEQKLQRIQAATAAVEAQARLRQKKAQETEAKQRAKSNKTIEKTVAANREKQAKKRETARQKLIRRGPVHPELRELIKASGYLRQRKPVDEISLGNCYCMIRMLFEDRPDIVLAEGKMPNNDMFSWGTARELYIEESPDPLIKNDKRSVERLIKKYIAQLAPGTKPMLRSREERALLGISQAAAQ
jgi:hypothetical protein